MPPGQFEATRSMPDPSGKARARRLSWRPQPAERGGRSRPAARPRSWPSGGSSGHDAMRRHRPGSASAIRDAFVASRPRSSADPHPSDRSPPERVGAAGGCSSRRVALRLPHFYAAMAVVAQSDLVVTLPRSLAGRFAPGLRPRPVRPALRAGALHHDPDLAGGARPRSRQRMAASGRGGGDGQDRRDHPSPVAASGAAGPGEADARAGVPPSPRRGRSLLRSPAVTLAPGET
jgi:hypothetical protein